MPTDHRTQLRTEQEQRQGSAGADAPRSLIDRLRSGVSTWVDGRTPTQAPAFQASSLCLEQADDIFKSYMKWGHEKAALGGPYTLEVPRDQLDQGLALHFGGLWNTEKAKSDPVAFFNELKVKAFGQVLEQRKQQSGGLTTAAITPEEMSHAIAQATGCLSIEGRSHDEAFDLLFRDCATQARNMDLSKPIGYGGNGDDLALKVRCRLVDQMPDKAVMTRIRKETLSAVQAMRKKAGTVSAYPPKRAELRKALDQAIDKIVQPTAREKSLRIERSLDVFW